MAHLAEATVLSRLSVNRKRSNFVQPMLFQAYGMGFTKTADVPAVYEFVLFFKTAQGSYQLLGFHL